MDNLLLHPAEPTQAIGSERRQGYDLIVTGEWSSVWMGATVGVPVDARRLWTTRHLETRRP